MIEAIIFDMDGVLIDSEPFWRKAEIKVFAQYGVQLTEDMCRKMAGIRLPEVVQHWIGKYGLHNVDKTTVEHQILEEVKNLVLSEGEALPGVFEVMQHFKQQNIPMALASSSPRMLIDSVVQKLNLQQYLTFTESAELLEYGKPHPEVFLNTAKRLGVDPQKCLVFEDSVFGVLAAKSALMRVIAIPELEQQEREEFIIADLKLLSLKDFSMKALEEFIQN